MCYYNGGSRGTKVILYKKKVCEHNTMSSKLVYVSD